jgi:hypothetical protein
MILADFKIPTPLRPVFRQIARVVCPPDAEELGALDGIIDHFEMSLRTLPAYLRVALMAGTTTFEVTAAADPRSLGRRFSKLPLDKAERWYHTWHHAPIFTMRQFAQAVKALIILGYYEQPQVRRKIGYQPDGWVAEAAKKRLVKYGVAIAQHEEELRAPDPLIAPTNLTKKVHHGHEKAS